MKQFVTLGALWCLLGVVAGSLGAHGLKELITKMGGANNFSLATHYMFYHGLGLIAVGLLKDRYPDTPFQFAGWLFVAGFLALVVWAIYQRRTAVAAEPEISDRPVPAN